MALDNGFMSYDSENENIFDLKEVDIADSKRARGASAALTPLVLPANPAVYQTCVSQVILESVQNVYDEYRGVRSGPNDASLKTGAIEASLEKLLEQELLRGEAADARM